VCGDGAQACITKDDAETLEVRAWPDTELVLTSDHPELPGVRLRRSVPLFDELGRRAPPEYADVHLHLWEHLATQPLPRPLPGQHVIEI
jgi:hypothetical protein